MLQLLSYDDTKMLIDRINLEGLKPITFSYKNDWTLVTYKLDKQLFEIHHSDYDTQAYKVCLT